MKMNRVFLAATVVAVSAAALSSCVYDPYYSSSSYRTGYGSGYGYGSRNFTTTYFVRTSSPRWAYDPYTRCYYDYSRRCYYDPYLHGYYPVGYRPMCIQGAPHPHGWRSGSSYIAAPSYYRDTRLSNYQHRDQEYRNLNQSWSRNVQINERVSAPQPNRSQTETRSQGFGNPFSFGSGRNNQTERTNDRSRNVYINDTGHESRSPQPRDTRSQNVVPRIHEQADPRSREQEAPRSHEPKIRNERSAPSSRSNDSNQERNQQRNELNKSSASRHAEAHAPQQMVSDRNREMPQNSKRNDPANPGLEGNP